ncbi:MAG: alpha/beta hydrolase [Actinomycetota bacterium]|nr:alpha/beta hydrolase [Actinomycetota bacterium]
MAGYVELTNGSVWYDEQGEGEPLVLLHGGAVDSRFFEHNLGPLAERFRVITTDLWGHGRTADREGRFTLESFATDVAELIEQVVEESAHVLGHSIGAGVALTLAMSRPDLIRRLVLASGGFDHEAEIGTEGGGSDEMVEQTVAFLGATYGAVSPDGEDHFPVVVRKDFELSSREPALSAEEVGTVSARTLVMVSDDDIVSLEHTLELYRALPDSELSVVPGTSHFLLQEKPEACNSIIIDFLTAGPVVTVAPVRRAPAQPQG